MAYTWNSDMVYAIVKRGDDGDLYDGMVFGMVDPRSAVGETVFSDKFLSVNGVIEFDRTWIPLLEEAIKSYPNRRCRGYISWKENADLIDPQILGFLKSVYTLNKYLPVVDGSVLDKTIIKDTRNMVFKPCIVGGYRNRNFARDAVKMIAVQDGDVFINCNLSQEKAHTVVFKNAKKLRFVGCNLMNCDLPLDTTKEKCLNVQKDVVPKPDPTPEETCKSELEEIKERYGAVATTEAKIVFDLKVGEVI